jgi:hypothetical protein
MIEPSFRMEELKRSRMLTWPYDVTSRPENVQDGLKQTVFENLYWILRNVPVSYPFTVIRFAVVNVSKYDILLPLSQDLTTNCDMFITCWHYITLQSISMSQSIFTQEKSPYTCIPELKWWNFALQAFGVLYDWFIIYAYVFLYCMFIVSLCVSLRQQPKKRT